MQQSSALRRVVTFVALANLSYFAIEFAVAAKIGSVSLFADSVDFLEDALVNLLILFALAWAPPARARLGLALSALLLAPAIATLWAIWTKANLPIPPEPWLLSWTGLGALGVNLVCAFALARFRHERGSLTKAAFLSARNDAAANVGIIGAGVLTAYTASFWPDLVVGVCIAVLNADAAREVWQAARAEARAGP